MSNVSFHMSNPFTPPTAPVADASPTPPKPSWLRTALLIAACGSLSLALSWLLAPKVAGAIAQALGITGTDTPPEFLAIDLALSVLAFIAGSYLAAKLSHGHAFVSAAGVGLVGWLVYFTEVGGLQGMLNSEFPSWYEFFPSHSSAALVAWLLARQRRNES
jgi:hypothetical protein